jgi:pimeloyl-ACP methyl ester carboxylesterase
MDTIEVEGATLSAMALGAPDAPPLVMLHGLVTGNMASWYSSAALPLSATHRVLLYDLRGHGDSTVPDTGFSLQSQARDLAQVLAFYGCDATEMDLVGYSMGALIALHFALRHPARVRRLVLVDAPMPASTHVAPSLHRIAADAAAHLAASGLSGRRLHRLRRRLEALLHGTTLVHDVTAMQAEPDHLLAAFPKPVLLVYGTRSPCSAAGTHLHRMLPQATLSWLETGHDVPGEAPVALLRQIRLFLSGREV